MDGTLEQFGWDDEDWLLSLNDFEDLRLNLDYSSYPYTTSLEKETEAAKGFGDCDRGFWRVVQERLLELVAQLDWDRLAEMEEEERVEQIKRQAKQKLKGAYREAWQRQQEDKKVEEDED